MAKLSSPLGFKGIISVAARYEAHVTELENSGVDFFYNYYAGAGEAFALAVCSKYLEVEEEKQVILEFRRKFRH